MGLPGYTLETGLARFLDGLELHSTPLAPSVPESPRRWRAEDRLTPDEVAELVVRYEAGDNSRQLGEQFGLSKTAVVRLLRDLGITIRPTGTPPGKGPATL